jgi:hypothetical protein
VKSAFGSAETRTSTKLIAFLIAIAPILVTSQAAAGTINVKNPDNVEHKFDFSFDDSNGKHFVGPVTVKAGMTYTLGGPKSNDPMFKEELVNPKVSRDGGSFASLNLNLDDTNIGASQFAFLLAAADDTSSVFSFFNFSAPNFTELVANTNFDFAGFNSNHEPILTLVGMTTPITDSSGDLLPQFQFNRPTVVVGIVTNPATVPEPSTYFMFGTGLLGLLGYCWRRGTLSQMQCTGQ